MFGEVSNHQEVNAILFCLALINRQILQMNIPLYILHEQNLSPIFQLQLQIIPIKQIICLLLINLHIRYKHRIIILRILLKFIEKIGQNPRYNPSLLPFVFQEIIKEILVKLPEPDIVKVFPLPVYP